MRQAALLIFNFRCPKSMGVHFCNWYFITFLPECRF